MQRGTTFLLLIHPINESHALVIFIDNLRITGIHIWSFHSQLFLSAEDLILYLLYTHIYFICVYTQVYLIDGNFSSVFKTVVQ